MSFKSKLDKFDRELDSKINLGKKFPGYFNKWIFRFMLAGIFVVVLAACQSMNWDFSLHHYEFCPGPTKCENVFYQCNTIDCFISQPNKAHTSCPSGFETDALCTQEFIFPGQYLGDAPSWFVLNAGWFMSLVIVVSFLVNHLVYKVKSRW